MNSMYIGTTEAAFRLHLSPQRVRKLAIEGRIEGAFKEGRHWKIPLFNGMPKISCKEKGPKGHWRKRQQKVMTFVHVNQTKLRNNRKNKTMNPVIAVKRGSTSVLCNVVEIPGFGRLIYDPEHPKDCGATLWFEIEPHIELKMNCFA
ncbi:helix-turn-helix domain-containing protein [Crocosphaera sp. XPORK-15E]|uniref:helix-turn-helix domain-containing protein n=1 Tax=Crocosphaera sp. XPORK-15E TaxID=3110247 RepID=UPI002B20CC15|nr:helix-turn-helix domain-containing protein [Crocosphaera sp. XPORK-15E]MEA5536257.1 helix-turn-helix domain-containing protein [Crocosphaera sp. XPORK-15E]